MDRPGAEQHDVSHLEGGVCARELLAVVLRVGTPGGRPGPPLGRHLHALSSPYVERALGLHHVGGHHLPVERGVRPRALEGLRVGHTAERASPALTLIEPPHVLSGGALCDTLPDQVDVGPDRRVAPAPIPLVELTEAPPHRPLHARRVHPRGRRPVQDKRRGQGLIDLLVGREAGRAEALKDAVSSLCHALRVPIGVQPARRRQDRRERGALRKVERGRLGPEVERRGLPHRSRSPK